MKASESLRARVLVATALAVLAVTAAGAQPRDKDDWVEVATPHFTLYSQASPSKTESTGEALLGLYLVMEHLGLDVGAERGRPTTFILFRNEHAFRPYMRSQPGKGIVMASEAAAVPGRSYVLLNGGERTTEFLPWALSAYASTLIHAAAPSMPFWLKRGLATFYSTLSFERKAVKIGLPLPEAIEVVRGHSLIPLGQFFRIEQAALDDPLTVRVHRAQAWLMAHFLMTGGGEDAAKGAQVYRQILQGVSSEEAIRSVYGTDMAGFEKRLLAYARAGSMPYFTLERSLFELPAVESEKMTTEEITFQLGLYLVAAHRPVPLELTEAHLEPLAGTEGARQGDALAALAELRRRAGRGEEAAELFRRASEAGPREAMSYYFLGDHRKEAGDLPGSREALERATELEAAFVEAWLALAGTYGSGPEAAEAIPALERALELEPGRADIAYSLAVLHLNAEQPEAARRVAESHLAGPDERRRAEQILRQAARREAIAAVNAASEMAAADPEAAAESLRRTLATVTEPGLRRQVEERLAAIEGRATFERQRAVYERAVDLFEEGEVEAARALLAEIETPIDESGLRRAVEELREAIAGRTDG